MSFSAEIKDFVAGFQAGSRVGGDIQDRKMAREKWEFDKAFKEKEFASEEARYADSKAFRDKGFEYRKARDAKSDADRKEAASNKERARDAYLLLKDETPKEGTKAKGQPQYPDEVEFDDEELGNETTSGDLSAIPMEPVTGEQVNLAKRGGLILHAQNGALIEINDEEEKEDAPAAAIPVDATPDPAKSPKGDGEDVEVDRSGKGDSLFKEAAEVARDVMDKWNEELKEKPEALSTDPKKDQSRISQTEPATWEEMKAIYNKVDPSGEMDRQAKGAAALVDAYNFFIERGEVENARVIAKKILDFNSNATKALGSMSLEALRQGDLQATSKLLSDAYSFIPDGGKLEAQPTERGTVAYKIDREGYAQQRGEVDARQLWQLATGVASGKEFINRMTALVGEVPAKEKKSSRTVSYSDTVNKVASAQKEYESAVARYNQATPEEKRKMRDQLTKLRSAYEEAFSFADKVREKSGRPKSEFQKDLKSALGSVPSALPPEPEADKPEAKTYNSDVMKAARAQSELEALTSSYENLETDEERRAAYPQLQAKQEEYNAAYEVAAKTGEALGRDVLADIGKAAKNVPSALPLAPPEAPVEEPGWGEWWDRNMPTWMGGDDEPTGEAVPTAPAPAAPATAPAMSGRPIDATTMAKAKDAIAKGASREAVIKRLQDAGFDTRGL